MTKVAVLGTGAIGGCTAADLVEAGVHTVLIDQWPAHVEAMRRDGLAVTSPDREQRVEVEAYHPCDLRALDRRFDIVLLAVKAYDTRWSCELVKPHLQPDGVIVGLQNAMTTSDIAEVVGASRTIGCVIEVAAEIFTPGLVKRHTPKDRTWFGLGGIDDAMSAGKAAEVEALLRQVGAVTPSSDILSGKWMKVVVNAVFLGFLGTLGLPIQAAAALPGARELMLRIGAVALEVGQRAGFKIEPIFGFKPEEIAGSNQLLEMIFDKLIWTVGPNARPAVLQDHLKGRYSEVDAINGLVMSEGERFGQSTPGNAAIVELTQRIFSGEIKPDPANLERTRALIEQPSSVANA